jgi:hypothetical protein
LLLLPLLLLLLLLLLPLLLLLLHPMLLLALLLLALLRGRPSLAPLATLGLGGIVVFLRIVAVLIPFWRLSSLAAWPLPGACVEGILERSWLFRGYWLVSLHSRLAGCLLHFGGRRHGGRPVPLLGVALHGPCTRCRCRRRRRSGV